MDEVSFSHVILIIGVLTLAAYGVAGVRDGVANLNAASWCDGYPHSIDSLEFLGLPQTYFCDLPGEGNYSITVTSESGHLDVGYQCCPYLYTNKNGKDIFDPQTAVSIGSVNDRSDLINATFSVPKSKDQCVYVWGKASGVKVRISTVKEGA